MTSKNSICFKCVYLVSHSTDYLTIRGEKHLFSYCSRGGGRNAGNRKTCKQFVKAPDETIVGREKVF